MDFIDKLINIFPEVKAPTQKRLPFKEKIKWTLIILVVFFILGMIPLFGLGQNAMAQFEYLSIILGAKFGSIISLGIGPIVTASIVLQLLNGTGMVHFDLHTHEGKRRFQGIQKLLALFFVLLEAAIYVFMGGLAPSQAFQGTPLYFQLQLLLILQLFLGGIMILFMDEIVSKWGLGSGISLFIAAGVSQQIFVRALSWVHPEQNPEAFAGAIPELIRSLGTGETITAMILLSSLVFTVLVFIMAVYVQAMKVEIPLGFGRIRGHGIRWPLNFMYPSNIPVILVAALLANIQLFARLVFKASESSLAWLNGHNIIRALITGSVTYTMAWQSAAYVLIMMGGALLFGFFWVQSSGLDPASQAENIMSSGLHMPGFRRDKRVLERLLARYIWPLTIMGSLAVGFLAAFADLTGSLSRGTGILLTVMIIYRLYEEVAKEHMMDMNPMMRKFMQS
ncbi:preprotein translocase subunit SecY [Candidatus Woesearchaeota archaeon]|nr:preprotein translocase subunit SecY [Candidatus Woesearchaeota archaeon]